MIQTTSTSRLFQNLSLILLVLAFPGGAMAFTSADADAVIDAYIDAYYIGQTPNRGYFRKSTAHPTDRDWFWEPAEKIEMMLDVYDRTGREDHLEIVEALLAGFIDRWGTDWRSNDFNDDIAWAVIAFSRTYQHTGNAFYLNVAKSNFDRMFARAWDDVLGGGLYWHNESRQSKNACINAPATIAAYLLYQILDDESYLDKANDIYDWTRDVLFEPDTGRVYDNIQVNGNIDRVALTYNQGTFIGAAHFLGHVDDAKMAANFTRNVLSRNGVLPQYGAEGNNSGFNGIFLRWMARFMKERGLEEDYLAWLQFNANTAWNLRRASDNLSWPQWEQQTPFGELRSWGGSPSVVALQVTPPDEEVSARPYSPSWQPETLLDWSPATDRDAPFNRSTVSLAPRESHPELKMNAHARRDRTEVMTLARFGPTTGAPAQGGFTENFYAFSHWQYIDTLVYWGGSALEGVIVAPTVTDVAHRNGVQVLGSIFFPTASDRGRTEWIRQLLQRDRAAFPVADKLIEAAEYFGFDGWLIRQQTVGLDGRTSADMRDFIRYLRDNSDLEIVWYDSMDEWGNVVSRNVFDENNDAFLRENGERTADAMVLDDGWISGGSTFSNLTVSRQTARALRISANDLFAGIGIGDSGFETYVDWERLFPSGEPHKLSLALVETDWTLRSATGPNDFHARENRLWTGENGDPSDTATNHNWKGVAHYIPAKTPATTLPFVTHFNRGHGSLFAVDGQIVRTGPWNQLGLQDILPTWRWIVRSDGARLDIGFDMSDPYFGGSSLRIAGTTETTNMIPLYQTDLPISEETRLEIVFKRNTSRSVNGLEIGLAFTDDLDHFEYFDVGAHGGREWSSLTFDLSTYAGKTLGLIQLRFAQEAPLLGYEMHIGRLAIYNGNPAPPAMPGPITVLEKMSPDLDAMALRLQWKPSPDPVRSYHVYQRRPGGGRTWLGATPNSAYFVAEARRFGTESVVEIEVEAVGADFAISSPTSIRVNLPGPDLNHPLPGTIIGTLGSWNNRGDTRENVFDGRFDTAFDAQNPDGAWVGLDLGSRSEWIVTAVRYAPRQHFIDRMPGGVFQGANEPDFSDAVTLGRISAIQPYGQMTSLRLSNNTRFRYVRYLGPNGSHCNIAELEFFGTLVPEAPGDLAGRMVEGTATLTWNATDWATAYEIKRSTSAEGMFETIAGGIETLTYTDPGLSPGATYYYKVAGTNEAATGPDSATLALFDRYYHWLQQHGREPGATGTAFAETPPDESMPNGLTYAVPDGLRVHLDGGTPRPTFELRTDPSLAETLWTSPDLIHWTPASVVPSADQTNVAPGFLRLTTAPASEPVSKEFYRLEIERK